MIRLTRREVEAIQLSALGLTDKQIARRLGIAAATVNNRVALVVAKSGAQHRAHAIALLIASGVIRAPARVEVAVVPGVTSGPRPLHEFAEDYKILSGRGLSRQDIATKLNLKVKTVNRYVTRARKAGLLPPYNGRTS